MSLFDVFPWNIESGPVFLAGYAGLSTVVLIVLAILVRRILDREPVPHAASGSPYRTPESAFTLEDAWLAAELRGGVSAVREAMLAALVTAGGLVRGTDGKHTVSSEPLGDRSLEKLRRRIVERADPSPQVIATEALAVASIDQSRRRAALEEAGLVATEAQRARVVCLTFAVVTPLLAVGLLRFVRGAELHHAVGLLGFVMFALAVAAFAIAAVQPRTSAATDRLDTLANETLAHAFRARTGKASVLDAGLAAAIFGLASLDATPAFAAISSALQSGGGSDGGGSCGGGGCGGGGCGGGCGG